MADRRRAVGRRRRHRSKNTWSLSGARVILTQFRSRQFVHAYHFHVYIMFHFESRRGPWNMW